MADAGSVPAGSVPDVRVLDPGHMLYRFQLRRHSDLGDAGRWFWENPEGMTLDHATIDEAIRNNEFHHKLVLRISQAVTLVQCQRTTKTLAEDNSSAWNAVTDANADGFCRVHENGYTEIGLTAYTCQNSLVIEATLNLTEESHFREFTIPSTLEDVLLDGTE